MRNETLISRITQYFSRKSNPVASTIVAFIPNPTWPKTDYKRLAEEGYQKNWAVYACVNEISNAVASILNKNLLLNQVATDGNAQEIIKHPILSLLKRPNSQESGDRFIKRVVNHLLIAGNAYINLIVPGGKVVRSGELWSLRPDRIKINTDPQEMVGGYTYTVSAKKKEFKREDILHLAMFHPTDDFYGLSPLEVAARSVDSNTRAIEWNYALLDNMGRPSGVLTTEADCLDKEQLQLISQMFTEKYTGAKNAGTIPIVGGGLKFEVTNITPKDMDWYNGQILTTRQICAVFNVPPEIIGDSSSKTYNSYPEARKAFYQETVLPLAEWIIGEFNHFLVPRFGEGLELSYDKDGIDALTEDRVRLREAARQDVLSGIIEPDEAREEQGRAKKGGASAKQYISANMLPLSLAMGDDFSGNGTEGDFLMSPDNNGKAVQAQGKRF